VCVAAGGVEAAETGAERIAFERGAGLHGEVRGIFREHALGLRHHAHGDDAPAEQGFRRIRRGLGEQSARAWRGKQQSEKHERARHPICLDFWPQNKVASIAAIRPSRWLGAGGGRVESLGRGERWTRTNTNATRGRSFLPRWEKRARNDWLSRAPSWWDAAQ